jgi:DNA-binding transcriptional ArsR family regulator
MPVRATASRQLADLFGALSNPHRVRILEELRSGEIDVNGLQIALGLSQSAVSQHLAVLRAHRLVAERRDGRHVYYHTTQPALAAWILQGLDFIEVELSKDVAIREAVEEARRLWASHKPLQAEELS